MRLVYFLLVSLILVLRFPWDADASDVNDIPCNCSYCEVEEVQSIEDGGPDNETAEDENVLNMEDADGNGNRTICARDRDEEDRTFPSVCHMHCQNECTRYRVWIYVENNEKKYTAVAYRTNYYKLYDGLC